MENVNAVEVDDEERTLVLRNGWIFVDIVDRGDDVKKVNGIIVLGDDFNAERGIRPREARVLGVGPDITDISVGDRVLLEHGGWTRKIKLKGGIEGWVTEENKVLMVLGSDGG